MCVYASTRMSAVASVFALVVVIPILLHLISKLTEGQEHHSGHGTIIKDSKIVVEEVPILGLKYVGAGVGQLHLDA
jgi:hypothetical protein